MVPAVIVDGPSVPPTSVIRPAQPPAVSDTHAAAATPARTALLCLGRRQRWRIRQRTTWPDLA